MDKNHLTKAPEFNPNRRSSKRMRNTEEEMNRIDELQEQLVAVTSILNVLVDVVQASMSTPTKKKTTKKAAPSAAPSPDSEDSAKGG